MKRYGNLYHKITDIENIKLAHLNARKNKTHYREVKMVDKDINLYAKQIQSILINKTYKVSEYETFNKKDKGKTRKLYKLPYFPDRIIQHAIMQILEPIWKANLITDTYQAIKGRGAFKCLKKVKRNVQKEDCNYCLQIDVKKYYPSISNNLLKQTVRHKIKCKDTLWLLDIIIDSCKGVPIGNYISQYFGNIFLSKLDHKIKESVKAKNYYRYCDDIIILHKDKNFLHHCLKVIIHELSLLNLSVKENHQIYKITKDRGVDFLGVVTYKNKTKLRKRIAKAFKQATNKIDTRCAKSIICYYGWIKHTYSYNLWSKYIKLYLNRLISVYRQHTPITTEIKTLRKLTHAITTSTINRLSTV